MEYQKLTASPGSTEADIKYYVYWNEHFGPEICANAGRNRI